MYQGGLSTRDITRTMEILLEKKYSPGWVSRITRVVEEHAERFRKRRITRWYPIIYIDGTYLKVRRGEVEGEVVYIALGIDEEGKKEVLNFWTEEQKEKVPIYGRNVLKI